MKREGRQHGLVRSHMILQPDLCPDSRSKKIHNKFDSPPTAGIFQKVLSKPTNHSKFTGKCGRPRCAGCHDHPVSKSRDKAKGTQKLKSLDVLLNHRLVEWRFVGQEYGFVAAGNLGDLSGDYWGDGEEVEEDLELEEGCKIPMGFSDSLKSDSDKVKEDLELEEGCENPVGFSDRLKLDSGEVKEDLELEEGCENPVGFSDSLKSDSGEVNGVEEWGDWGFCEAGFVWEIEDEEDDWCVVEDM